MISMKYFGSVINNVKEFYNEINPATLTGAIDVVVVEQPDGSFTCSPFHVRFGKLGVLRSRLKVVDLELNGESLNIHMKLGESGEAFFVEEVPENEVEASAHLATSPIPDNGFPLYQEQILPPSYDNQISDFSQRRYTDGENSTKTNISVIKRDYQMLDDKFVFDCNPQSNQDQEMFIIEDLKDQQKSLDKENIPITAKTFRAEEVSDKESRAKDVVRKISINNDFKPISMETENVTNDSVVDSFENACVYNAAEDVQKPQTNNKKKKKTKKSGSKKKNANQRKLSSSSNGYSSQSETTTVETVDIEKSEDKKTETPVDKEVTKTTSFSLTDSMQESISLIHCFSDTDIPSTAPRRNSRPGTPVQSDSELELARGSGVQGSCEPGQSWRWGELPSPIPSAKSSISLSQPPAMALLTSEETIKSEKETTVASQTGGTSMLSGMFNFMKHSRATSTTSNQKNSDGVYLDQIAAGSIKPEVAALYFPSHAQLNNVPRSMPMDISHTGVTEEDYESGNGPSLPQSPSSVEGVMGKGDSDVEFLNLYCKGYVGLSLCGPACLEQSATSEAFEHDAVRYEQLCSDPSLLQNPKLVVRIGNKYMPWSAAAPALMSLLVYHRPLPKNVLQNLLEGKDSSRDNKAEDANQNLENKTQSTGGFTWWSWRRSADKQVRDESAIKNSLDIVDGKQINLEKGKLLQTESEDISNIMTYGEDVVNNIKNSEIDSEQGITISTQTPLHSFTGGGGYSGSQSSEESDEGIGDRGIGNDEMIPQKTKPVKYSDKFRKTLRLSSDEIASLNLREGMNEMVFSVTTAYQGTSRCKCHVFRWRYDDKIVISDIDGTITKSDVLGHIFPMVGKDWAQSGVAQLFTKIKNNGYKLLYLSARAIGQAKGTREYLKSIKQGDVSLPDGPLLLNPTSLLRAFHREVIEKKPEEFKIQCLKDIKALFPEGSKPFYAGYGNRTNDVCAYETVGIPIVRIFTINYKGELKHELTQTFQSSYSNMSYIVDHLFPPVRADVCEDFSQFVFWRQPIADLNDILPPDPSNVLSSIPEGSVA